MQPEHESAYLLTDAGTSCIFNPLIFRHLCGFLPFLGVLSAVLHRQLQSCQILPGAVMVI